MSSSRGSLPRYIAIRLLLIIPMMWVLLTFVFFLLRIAPGDPVTAAAGGKLSAEEIARRQAALGLDRPLLTQYLDYLGDVVRFQFGNALSDGTPVTSLIRDHGGATLTLTVGAFLFAVAVGVPLGRWAGRHRDTAIDAPIRILGIVVYAAPIFWVGILLIIAVDNVLPSWPTSGIASPTAIYEIPTRTHILLVDAVLSGDYVLDVLQHHVLPCLVLGMLLSGVIIRLVRINVIQSMQADYVEAARARGIAERKVVRDHAFRNALVPVVTVIGLQVALTLSGAVLTENTFNWPGLGTDLVDYVLARDYVAVQGLVTFFALVVVVVSVVVDVINALIDPRVRY
ncbi:ABC transporter permease [Nocardioides sambongensis]|uniref:ABC transporter permease n=1 Tax=Nocardioides sambongensis TaxID=2589074 RepID=UPI00112AEE12|nr:ABC transporter permease [Nocardioides sambongensis]